LIYISPKWLNIFSNRWYDRMTIQLNFQGWIGKKENSSIIEGRVCGYGAAQTDRYLLYADRMVSGPNEGACRLACDSERNFRCRSYSWHLHSSLACSLSSSTSSASNSYQVIDHLFIRWIHTPHCGVMKMKRQQWNPRLAIPLNYHHPINIFSHIQLCDL